MIGAVFELALSNALLSALLAVVAWLVQRHGRYPAVAHLLWVVVLVKAVTPPLLVMPTPLLRATAGPLMMQTQAVTVGATAGPSSLTAWPAVEIVAAALLAAWLIGGATVLFISLSRIRRFGRLLGDTSVAAPAGVVLLAGSVARELGLGAPPTLVVTHARVSPMTWWARGRVRLVLPGALVERADAAELRWVLAHELAHVKRRDHLVRWIEWAAVVAFWWNPVVWFARRNLRMAEEDACDALVLSRMAGAPRAYASTLLDVVEVLSQPVDRMPAMATGMDAARSLEHRLSMIVSARARGTVPRPLVVGLSAVVAIIMALGFGSTGAETADPASPEPRDATAEASATIVAEAPPQAAPVGYAPVSATRPVGRALTADTYLGTSGPDRYDGTGQSESISGFGGNDVLAGGRGRDTIYGGDGDDDLQGGAGADIIGGGAGADVIGGGAGHDTIRGGSGNDVIRTWSDGIADQVDCGAGKDRAVIDRADTATHCETVVIRDPA